jgi:phosphoenolpyruvate-protein phosphotransferase
MAQDPMLREAVENHLKAGKPVEGAVAAATDELAGLLRGMKDEMFAARATDVQDVGRRILRVLLGLPDTSLNTLRTPSIILAHDLTPSDTARLQPELTLGFCTAVGGITSHTAILARTLGIPAVVGVGQEALDQIPAGATLALDGSTGLIVVNPSLETSALFLEKRRAQAAHIVQLQGDAQQPAHTADDQRVEVGANIGDIDSAREAVRFGAEGVGLLRTEFLYLQDTQPPSEEKQVAIYCQIFEALQDRPVIVRTLDIGGDKPPSYLQFGQELNPFLGWRAIRICLDNLDLFKTQLRAILRAAAGHRALIMFPMISALEELRRAREVLGQARLELEQQGLEYAKEVPVGIMVETPASAAIADLLAAECDFLSLGTNDLTQYTLAVDRTNERVASLFQPLHPAILRLVRQTIEASHTCGIWTGMCGEMAGMKKAIPILLGMGLDEFSMAPRAIPAAKRLIRMLTRPRAAEIAEEALSLKTAAEVEQFMGRVLVDLGV